MHTLIFDKRNISLAYENSSLIIRQEKSPPRSIPLSHIRKIVCLHSVQLSTQLLGQLWQRGIDFITLNSRYSERCFALYPNQQQQIARRCLQYTWQQEESFCLPLAKLLCQHRLKNTVKIINGYGNNTLVTTLNNSQNAIKQCDNLSTLRGIEGAMQRQLFDYWRQQVPINLGFNKRVRRPPTDPINALLSLTYTLVMHEAIRQCKAAGLDSQLGFYHRVSFGRHSLACDLMEPTRPYCEEWVMHCFKEGLFEKGNFSFNSQGACFLGKDGREVFYIAIDEQLGLWQKQLQATARWISKRIDKQASEVDHANGTLVPNTI